MKQQMTRGHGDMYMIVIYIHNKLRSHTMHIVYEQENGKPLINGAVFIMAV